MRRSGTLFVALALVLLTAASATARPAWKRRIDKLVRGHSIGVSVAEDGRSLYRYADKTKRIPASNQKMLLSMAALDRLGPDFEVITIVSAQGIRGRVVNGDLWILGRGDPTLTGGGAHGRALPFRPARIAQLAAQIKGAGIRRVRGSVMGSTGYFARDWYAPGWKSSFAAYYVALPTALTFEGNVYQGRHVTNPEWRAARALTRRLQAKGVRVAGRPGTGAPPAKTTTVAQVRSAPLQTLLAYTNRQSSNFFAEVTGKRLGASARKPPGTIAKGAAVIAQWTRRHGVEAIARDSSGLSSENRVSPRGLVHLLEEAETKPWIGAFRRGLPVPGQGTLEDRLQGVKMRAKTGTLDGVSALSGWVWMERTDSWGEFSILSSGMSKSQAVEIEDAIVRTLARSARHGTRTTGTLTTWMGLPSWADDSNTRISASVSSGIWTRTFLL
ncbi:MAG TPA: D-alanyl-D-alanine carboxypeptidase [Actinomycetota bacterium]|nr:D-alanyl-D-alanine carboxypeptidase [Actinomycetota bacterium]